MFRTVWPTGIRTTTITFATWEEELQSYHKKFKEKVSSDLFINFLDFLNHWASFKEDGFLKNFLLEGVKITKQARDTWIEQDIVPWISLHKSVTVETIIFYLETLQTIVSKK